MAGKRSRELYWEYEAVDIVSGVPTKENGDKVRALPSFEFLPHRDSLDCICSS